MTSKIMTSKEELSKKYQKKSDKQHVLDNPDTYIGSIKILSVMPIFMTKTPKKLFKNK